MTTVAIAPPERTQARPSWDRGTKRLLDLTVSFFLVLLTSPIALVIAVVVKLTSPGPVIYRQTRVGRHGCEFQVLKFRTMYHGNSGPPVTTANDTRITPTGRWLRRHRLDEWPQLWNIVRGDMSLVGPRPEVPGMVAAWPPEAFRLLEVRPGLTDPATLGHLNEDLELAAHACPEDWYRDVVMPRKLEISMDAAGRASLKNDLAILLRTAVTLVGGSRPIPQTPLLMGGFSGKELQFVLNRPVDRPSFPSSWIHGKSVMITGAGGSLGSLLVKRLLECRVGEIIAVDRSENALFRLGMDCSSDRLKVIIRDVSDEHEMSRLVEKHQPSILFHAAAHKHVTLMETQPLEAVRNNILTTAMLAHQAAKSGCSLFVMASTDKAADPVGVMGASKRAAEMVLLAESSRSPETVFSSVRLPNILGSDGSVLTVFQKQLQSGEPLTITDPEARRFFFHPEEAVDAFLAAASFRVSGQIIVPEPLELSIADVAQRAAALWAPHLDPAQTTIGLRPGEKKRETLVGSDEETIPVGDSGFRLVHEPAIPVSLREEIEALRGASDAHDESESLTILARLAPGYRP